MQRDERHLAERIERKARETFEGKYLSELLHTGRKAATSAVMTVFGDLGKDLGYKVIAKGYGGDDENGEWLYDMVWFVQDDRGFLVRLPLVLESEWDPDLSVDGDFQKLVQTRADLRVWLSACPNSEISQRHINNCKIQARAFANSLPTDTYIFVVYDWTAGTTHVERSEVGNADQH